VESLSHASPTGSSSSAGPHVSYRKSRSHSFQRSFPERGDPKNNQSSSISPQISLLSSPDSHLPSADHPSVELNRLAHGQAGGFKLRAGPTVALPLLSDKKDSINEDSSQGKKEGGPVRLL
jgi:hypothetical protein